jgi:hypothetical protein
VVPNRRARSAEADGAAPTPAPDLALADDVLVPR